MTEEHEPVLEEIRDAAELIATHLASLDRNLFNTANRLAELVVLLQEVIARPVGERPAATRTTDLRARP